MAAMRLRLTGQSMASPPCRTKPHADDGGLHAALGRRASELASFHEGLAAQVGTPGRMPCGSATTSITSRRRRPASPDRPGGWPHYVAPQWRR